MLWQKGKDEFDSPALLDLSSRSTRCVAQRAGPSGGKSSAKTTATGNRIWSESWSVRGGRRLGVLGGIRRRWWNNNNAELVRLKFAHENPLPVDDNPCLSQFPCKRVALGEPANPAAETQRGFFVLFCLCLSCLFLKGFLKDDNIF